MQLWLRLLALVITLSAFAFGAGRPNPSASSENAVGYNISPPDSWVKPLDPDEISTPNSADVEGGVDYLLVDNQQLVNPTACFTHHTLRLANDQGLQTGSDIRAEFDPSYQTLTLHWLKVKRGGIWQDRLKKENFQVLRREENLDAQTVNGRYSVVCQLQDIRVGDLVDFAYTVKGANPVFRGKFFYSFFTTFLKPVHRFSNQLTVPSSRRLLFKCFGGATKPTRTSTVGDHQMIVWDNRDVPAAQLEPRTPEWYDVFAWVELTEFSSWKDVVEWGLATFSLNDPPSHELGEKIAEIARLHNLPEDRALAVFDFLQNEVRYLAMEMGPNSYLPTPASVVFENRFGDCKDKTQLAVTMLRVLGIEACPALVNTRLRAATDTLLPSPLAFDHAIVQLIVDGETYWIDATRSNQRGRLRDFYLDEFKQALLLKPGVDALARINASGASNSHVAVDETFIVKSVTEPGRLIVHNVFEGESAEENRALFKNLSHETIEKAYLNYYSRQYGQIAVATPLRFEDYSDSNRYEVWLDYTIANLWTRETPTSAWKAHFTTLATADAIGTSTSTQRKAPYHLDYPSDTSENIVIQTFRPWKVDPTPVRIETPNFMFNATSAAEGNNVSFTTEYRVINPDVLPADIGNYNEQSYKLRDHLTHSLTYLPGTEVPPVNVYQPNWIGFILVSLMLALSGYGAKRINAIRRPPDPTASQSGLWTYSGITRYHGIGGWMLWPVFALAIGMFFEARATYLALDLTLNLAKWNLLTLPEAARYEPFWAPALLFEACAGVGLLVFSVLAFVLLFQKRWTFPKVMVGLLIAKLVVYLVDNALLWQIHTSTAPKEVFTRTLVQLLIACAIWVPYFLLSKRVKATFRR
jgi:transglutaminase-like putative cysteine protease